MVKMWFSWEREDEFSWRHKTRLLEIDKVLMWKCILLSQFKQAWGEGVYSLDETRLYLTLQPRAGWEWKIKK